jgi:NitT/TauT family transport system substrate-binding protein
MSRLWLLPALAVLLSAFGPSASAGPPLPAPAAPAIAGTAQTLTVRVGALSVAANAPLHLARERGYLREEGLDAEVTAFDSGQQMIAPLGADQFDAGLGSVGPGLSNALLRGINLRIVADAVRAAPGAPRYNCLLVRQELLDSGAVRTVADLRGRVYAENVPRNINTYAFERDLRQAGVQPDEVRYVTIPFPDMLAGFANGLIDAAHMTEPFVTQAEERGVSRCWRPLSETAPDMQLAVLLYGPVFAEQRPEAARGFMVAYLRGIRDYHRAFFGDGQGRAEVLELLTRITPIRDLALLERIGPPWMDPNGGVNVASLSAIQRWYLERGDLTQEVDMARVVDPTFVDYALGRLGRY